MQIACEKCSTTYTLDERLIPPGGAPVQCTRCAHVFIALGPSAAPVQRSGTQIFGVKPPGAQSAPAAEDENLDAEDDPRGNTQIFGRVPPPPPESAHSPQISAPASNPRSTQMFGAVGQPQAPAAPASNPRSTQVFGAVGQPQAPAAPASNPRTTQMFGAVGQPQAPAAPASNPRSTQMFGAVGQPQAPAAPASSPRTTQMFGAVGQPQAPAAPPAPPRSTQMFGAVGQSQAPAAPAAPPRSTQMFGAVGQPPASAASSSPPQSTQALGTVEQPAPAAPAASPRTTQMFGAVSQPPAPASPPHSTQMSGAVSAPAAAEQRSSTQMFGAVSGPAGSESAPQPQRPTTQMFGAVGQPPAPAAPAASPRTTQMFGAVAASPSPAAQPRSSTAMFGAVQPAESASGLPKITFDGEAVSTPSPLEVTQTEARAPFALADPRDIDPAMASTQSMPAAELAKAMAAYRAAEVTRLPKGTRLPDTAASPIPLQSQPPAPGMTAELQVGAQHLPPRPGMTAEMQFQGTLPPRPGMTAEMQFQGTLPPRPGMTAELQVDHEARTPLAGTPAYAPVQLPPELPGLEELEAPGRSPRQVSAPRKSALPAVLGLVALLALGGVGYLLLAKRTPSVPPEASAAREAAVVLLRRDDPGSRLRSIAELQRVVAQQPKYLEAQADLVTALALQLDDTRAQQERALGEVRVLENEIERLTNAQSPSDWQNRVYVLGDEVSQLRREGPHLQEQTASYDQRLREEHARLQQLASEREELEPGTAAIHRRAQALFASVNPTEETLAKLKAYEAEGTSEGWAKVALAQFVLNSRSSLDVVNRGRTAIEELVQADSSFIRPYVLAARIAIRQERYEAAVTTLEAAAALNPEHQTARDLLEWALASQRAVEAAR